MPSLVAKKIIKEFAEMNGSIIHFTGGEPTIHPNFEELCSYAKSLGLQVSTNTNCLKKIDTKSIDKLKASFDTCDKDKYNQMVELYCFDEVVNNLKSYSNSMGGKMLSITAVLNKQTFRDMLKLAVFCKENFKLYNLYYSNYKGNNSDFAFSKEEIEEMFSFNIPETIKYFDSVGEQYSCKQLRLYTKKDFINGERFDENLTIPCYIQLSEMVIDTNGFCHNCSHLFRDGVSKSDINVTLYNLADCFRNVKSEMRNVSCFTHLSNKCLTGCNRNLIGFNKAVTEELEKK
jgi:MoaA/NifB/PqqE/SkfB family radical SAM enzyme